MKVSLPPANYLPSREIMEAAAHALGFHCSQQFFDTAQTSHLIMFRLICWQHEEIERLRHESAVNFIRPEPMIP